MEFEMEYRGARSAEAAKLGSVAQRIKSSEVKAVVHKALLSSAQSPTSELFFWTSAENQLLRVPAANLFLEVPFRWASYARCIRLRVLRQTGFQLFPQIAVVQKPEQFRAVHGVEPLQ
jgi:hypothetical protein